MTCIYCKRLPYPWDMCCTLASHDQGYNDTETIQYGGQDGFMQRSQKVRYYHDMPEGCNGDKYECPDYVERTASTDAGTAILPAVNGTPSVEDKGSTENRQQSPNPKVSAHKTTEVISASEPMVDPITKLTNEDNA